MSCRSTRTRIFWFTGILLVSTVLSREKGARRRRRRTLVRRDLFHQDNVFLLDEERSSQSTLYRRQASFESFQDGIQYFDDESDRAAGKVVAGPKVEKGKTPPTESPAPGPGKTKNADPKDAAPPNGKSKKEKGAFKDLPKKDKKKKSKTGKKSEKEVYKLKRTFPTVSPSFYPPAAPHVQTPTGQLLPTTELMPNPGASPASASPILFPTTGPTPLPSPNPAFSYPSPYAPSAPQAPAAPSSITGASDPTAPPILPSAASSPTPFPSPNPALFSPRPNAPSSPQAPVAPSSVTGASDPTAPPTSPSAGSSPTPFPSPNPALFSPRPNAPSSPQAPVAPSSVTGASGPTGLPTRPSTGAPFSPSGSSLPINPTSPPGTVVPVSLPVAPTNPSGSAGPVAPTVSSSPPTSPPGSVAPAAPSDSSNSKNPTSPPGTSGPLPPSASYTPVAPAPVAPSASYTPVAPTPVAPSASYTPLAPTVPTDTFAPVAPSGSSTPVAPSLPTGASGPVAPSGSSTPVAPTIPPITSSPVAPSGSFVPVAPSVPTGASAPVAPTAPSNNIACPSIPENGCSVCGEGNCVTDPDAIFSFPGQPTVSCGILQDAGYNGLVPLDQCSLLPDVVLEACGCQDSLPLNPTPAPTLGLAGSVDCDAIAAGNASTTTTSDGGGAATNEIGLTASLELTIANGTEHAPVAAAVHGILQTRVAPAVAGCRAALAAGTRTLQSSTEDSITTIHNVLFSVPETDAGASCNSEVKSATCYPTSSNVDIYYTGTDTTGFKERLEGEINAARVAGLFSGIDGLERVGPVVVAEGDAGDTGGAAGVTAVKSSESNLAVGGIAAIAVAGVALVAFLILFMFMRRSQSEQEEARKHVYMIDDNSNLLTDLDSQESPTKKRVAHVVGEDDSVHSGWTGYTPEYGPDGRDILSELNDMESDKGFEMGMDGRTQSINVHQCSSATCEICLAQQQRPKFVPIGKPPRSPPRLPTDAQRHYVADDTVSL